jgi:hypothetical protein
MKKPDSSHASDADDSIFIRNYRDTFSGAHTHAL